MSTVCERCRRSLTPAAAYQFHGADGPHLRCGACALVYRPLLRRSFGICLVVGTVLLGINQGDVLLGGHWPATLAWKIPLTYLVPFIVATWGALLNSRLR